MAIEGAEIDGFAGAAARTEHVEPRRAGEQRRPDRRRPQHVAAKGKLFIPALDDDFSLGARGLVSGVAHGAGFDVQPPRPNPHDGPHSPL
jgi:hypothetical protein